MNERDDEIRLSLRAIRVLNGRRSGVAHAQIEGAIREEESVEDEVRGEAVAYWLLKTEPDAYSFEDLEREGRTQWNGVRNYEARNNLRAMSPGDQCFIYHTVGPREIVGIAEVAAAPYADPADADGRWICVDVRPLRRLRRPVALGRIKEDVTLRGMALVRNSRLSVSPVTSKEWKRILVAAESER